MGGAEIVFQLTLLDLTARVCSTGKFPFMSSLPTMRPVPARGKEDRHSGHNCLPLWDLARSLSPGLGCVTRGQGTTWRPFGPMSRLDLHPQGQ